MPLENRRHGRTCRFALFATVALSMTQGCTHSTKPAPRSGARGPDVEERSDLRPHFLAGSTGAGGGAETFDAGTAGMSDGGSPPTDDNGGAEVGGAAGRGDAGDGGAPEICGDGRR